MKKAFLVITIVAAGATMMLDAEQPVNQDVNSTDYDTIIIRREGQTPDTIIMKSGITHSKMQKTEEGEITE